ncbi:minor capsid protein [Corallococcus sp. Z5C101001]|uniref:minor capsid protein n=1 Tax=Corallococcus sp. Z5C101001 TaxID=2596829 RepID=UPI00351A9BFC
MPEVDGTMPDRAVALVVTGGAAPQPYVGKGRAAYLLPSSQVRIRSGREDFEVGQQLAHAVFAVLNQSVLVPYAVVRPEESAPIYLGLDKADRHLWALNAGVGIVA